jgi:superoxide reductase
MPEIRRRGFIKAAGVLIAGGIVGAGTARAADSPYGNADAALFVGINRVANPKDLTATELRHAPYITLPEKVTVGEPFEVKVSVGKTPHVMAAAHRITDLTLMVGNEPVANVNFTTGSMPVVLFMLKLDKPATLVAVARCNLHGAWEGMAEVVLS